MVSKDYKNRHLQALFKNIYDFEFMTKRKYTFIALILVLVFSCKNDGSNESERTIQLLSQDTITRMVVTMDNLRLRAAPGTNQEMVAELKQGAELETTGAISPLKTSQMISGIEREEPWVEVKTDDGATGWIFGGGVKVEGAQNTPVASVLRKERLSSFFGPEKTRQILQYRTDFYSVENPRDFENVFIRGTILRDSLVETMGNKIEIFNHENLPDLSWIEDAMPGFTSEMIAEGTRYYLFQDYGKMRVWAKSTSAEEDDAFFEFMTFVNADEDLEGFYPVWFEQAWEHGGYSLLGEGKHLSVLTRMEKLMETQKLFRNPNLKLKMKLLKDILNSPTGAYGASAEKITEEIDAIISADFKILSKAEKANLALRKKHFLEPAKFGLKLDLKPTNN